MMNRLFILLSISCFLFDQSIAQIPGLSVFLDGSKDYIEIEDNNSLDIEDEITIEAWINPCSYSSYNAIVAKQYCQEAQLSYYFGLRNGFLEWAWDDDGNCTISNVFRSNGPVIPIDQWTHVAVVHTPEGVRLFINGIESSAGLVEGSFSTINTTNSPVRIGVYRNQGGDYAGYFHGRIDDVRIWNQALSSSSIAERRNTALGGDEAGLVAYYSMEMTGEGQGIVVLNEANATGAVNNGITIGTDDSPGFVSTASTAVCGEDCARIIGSIYGSPGSDERGFSLIANAANDGFFVAGTKDNQLLILEADLDGEVRWSRTFDVFPGEAEWPFSIIQDSDGMLAVHGTTGVISVGGRVFILRYDPLNHQVLWTKDYSTSINTDPDGIIQKGVGGNYLMTNNPNFYPEHVDTEILEIDRNTGNVLPSFAKIYRLTRRESLFQIIYDGNFLYGTGRYRAGGDIENVRNAIVKLNANDGSQVWGKLGHVGEDEDARLYGAHLLIDNNAIISGSYGDSAGLTTANSDLYLQKTSLDGELIWIRRYELGGTNTFSLGIIKSGNGYVVMGSTLTPDQVQVMLKVDLDGNLLWSKTFEFPSFIDQEFINGTIGIRGKSKVIQVGDQLIFTGYVTHTSGDHDMFIVRTDLDGNVNDQCTQSTPYPVAVTPVASPVFNDFVAQEFPSSPDVIVKPVEADLAVINPIEECIITQTITTTIDTTLCKGESYQGYSVTGEYIDEFITPDGCDSIRTLNLTILGCDPIIHWGLEACESYMHNGSHMIFTEFTPDYPVILTCADVEADHVDMLPSPMSKHSCTPGVNGSVAMCIGASPSCTYNPGEVTSLIFSFTVEVPQDSSVQVTGFEFYEKAPTSYTWIDGPSGPNNYPRFYGIRILKNGTEIFQQSGIATTGNWTLQRFDFLTDSLFRVEEDTDFRIELLPYCPVGNGAEVSAWDIDEIRVFGGCIPFVTFPIISGDVATKTGKRIRNTYLHLAENDAFDVINSAKTDANGHYSYDDLKLNTAYYVRGYNNKNELQGVSTLDLIMMQRHLLGIQPLSTLHQYIAADINHNGAVSIIDVVELRKLMLGIYNEFPKNTSWRFGVLPQDFTGTDISTFTEVGYIESLQDGLTIVNFEGIKIGDVNEDIKLNLQGEPIITRNADKVTFRIDDVLVKKGDAFTMEVTSENIDELQGFQLALLCKDLSLVSVQGAALPISDEHISFTNEGLLRISWNHDRSYHVGENEVLFTITFTASSAGMISDKISLQLTGLQPEAYTGSALKVHDLNIAFAVPFHQSDIQSFRIEPNPLQTDATVKFHLVKGGETVINFFDLSGKLLYSIKNEYSKGDHAEQINAKDLLSGDGIIYCQLVCNGYTNTQKVVLLRQ